MPCAHCGTVGFVRTERVVSGQHMVIEYYCGHCERGWRVPEPVERRAGSAERRRFVRQDRRTRQRDARFRDSANVSFADVEDWELVCSTRVNVWLRGPQHTKRAALATISPSLVEPVVTVPPGTALDFLPRSPSIATLIVEDVSALGLDDQRCLFAWLDEIGEGARVISITSVPILPLIETGVFLASLYYRLNSVYVDLTPERKHAH